MIMVSNVDNTSINWVSVTVSPDNLSIHNDRYK